MMEEDNKQTSTEQQLKNTVKESAVNAAKSGAKKGVKVVAKAAGSFIMAHLPIILIIVIIFVLANNLFNIFSSIGSMFSNLGQSLLDFFTSDDEEEINKRVDLFIEQLEASGIDLDAMKLSGEIDYTDPNREEAIKKAKRKYIRKFLEAQSVTQTINKTTNQTGKGRVYVYRNTPDGNVVDNSSSTLLHYVSMEQLENLKASAESSGNYSSILNYFSINDSNQIVVPEIVTTDISKDGGTPTTNATITLRGKDYIDLISPYSTSAQLFIYLGLIVQNPEFLAAFSDLVKDSEIHITLLDTTTRTETQEVYTYIQHTEVIDYEWDYRTRKLVEVGSHFEEEEKTETTTTITTTITPSICVTYAKTWVAEQSIVYKKNPDNRSEPITNVSKPGNESLSSSYKTNQIITITETTTTSSWDSGTPSGYIDRTGEKDANGNWNKDSILGLLTTQYRIPNATRKEAAIYKLKSGASWLFQLLKQDQSTQAYEQVMRYILYKYTGDDKYGVTELDFDQLYGADFTQLPQYYGTGFWWPIGGSEIEIIDGKEFATGDPTTTKISSHFGNRNSPTAGASSYHQAIDIGSNGHGSNYHNVIASSDGVVTRVRDGQADGVQSPIEGNFVEIDHGNGIKTIYKHLYIGSIRVAVGDSVKQGELIAKMGNSGVSTGAHLHFEVRVNGTAVDPEEYVSAENPRPVGGSASGFSLNSTTFSQEEFKAKMLEYATKSGNSNFKTNFADHADEIYTASLSAGVNPELVVVTAGCETGWKKNSHNNYWGIGIPNGGSWSDGPYFATLTDGINRYASVIASYQPGGSHATLITQKYEARKADNCNPNGYGLPGTFAGMQSVYSDLCGLPNIHKEGNSNDGGNYYLKVIYGDQFDEKCGNVHQIGVDPYTNQELADYTAWQCQEKVELRYAIFGL